MRSIYPVMAAAALMAAGPAVAQDTNNAAAAAPVATSDANVAANATDVNAVAPAPGNEVAPAPEPALTDSDTSQQPAEKNSGGFPWGVLGLVGLLGLIPRRNRG